MAQARMRIERAPRPPRRIQLSTRRVVTIALGLSIAAAGTSAFAADLPLNGVSFSSSWDSRACASASVRATTTTPVIVRFVWLNANLAEIGTTEATLDPGHAGQAVASSAAPTGARAFVFDVLTTSRQRIPMPTPRAATCQRAGELPIGSAVPTTSARVEGTVGPTMHVPGLPGLPLPHVPGIPGLPGAGGPVGSDGADVIQGVPVPLPTPTATTVTVSPVPTSVGSGTLTTGTMTYDGGGARLALTPVDASTVRIDATSDGAPRGSMLVIRRASDGSMVSRLPMDGTKTVSLVAQPGEKYVATVVQRAGRRAAVSSGAFSVEGRGAEGAIRYTGSQPRPADDPAPTITVAPVPTTTSLPATRPTAGRQSPTSTTSTSRSTTSTSGSASTTSRTSSSTSSTTSASTAQPVPTTSADPTTTEPAVVPPLDIPAILQDNPASTSSTNLAQTGRNSGAGALLGGGLLMLGGAVVMMARRMKSHG